MGSNGMANWENLTTERRRSAAIKKNTRPFAAVVRTNGRCVGARRRGSYLSHCHRGREGRALSRRLRPG